MLRAAAEPSSPTSACRRELDLTPAPTDSNLAALAAALEPAVPRLRANDMPSPPIALGPDVIRAIPALPLSTQFGDLNIVLRPIGAPAEYEEVLG